MKKKFYVRFDDICPTMDWSQFKKAEYLMDKYDIKPLIGIVPFNKDSDLIKDEINPDFWRKMKELQGKGWVIALHGYTHLYDQNNPKTLICGRKHSEFAGNTYENQYNKIKLGKKILNQYDIFTDVFFAPAHTYDKNTLKALRANGFNYNIDGFSRKPFKRYGVINIPIKSFGISNKNRFKINVAICHCNEWSSKPDDYMKLVDFCDKNNVSNFDELLESKKGVYLIEAFYEFLFKLVYSLKKRIKRGV